MVLCHDPWPLYQNNVGNIILYVLIPSCDTVDIPQLLSLCSSPSTSCNLWLGWVWWELIFSIRKLEFSKMFFIAAKLDKIITSNHSLIVTFAGVPRPPSQGGGATPGGRQDQWGDPPRTIMQVRPSQTPLYLTWKTHCLEYHTLF